MLALNVCFLTENLDSTDFRQFEYYLNVTGLDVCAIRAASYVLN